MKLLSESLRGGNTHRRVSYLVHFYLLQSHVVTECPCFSPENAAAICSKKRSLYYFLQNNGRDWVLGDEHRIQQILANVITNAIKYTCQGSIQLIASWHGDQIQFECVDTGPGIPKGEQDKLFQRFIKRGGAPGTGLGLAIAKHLVDMIGGNIRFDSDPSVKAGTTCIVRLSLPECDTPDRLPENRDPTTVLEQALNILIVDDIKMNRTMLKRRILKGIAPNARCVEAATGEEAIEMCATQKFDVIIVDQYMAEAGGVMLGTDTVFALRRIKVDALIIGCSGNELGEEFTTAGADCVWTKPVPSNTEIIHLWRGFISVKGRA